MSRLSLGGGPRSPSVGCLAALPGGSRVAFGGDGRDVAVLDTATLAVVSRAKPPAPDWLRLAVRVCVASAAFLPSSPECVAVGGDGCVRVFDFRSERRAVATAPTGDGLVAALAIAPDGRTAFAGTTRGALLAVDLSSGRIAGALKGAGGALRCAAAHPHAPLLAVTGLDKHVRVFCTATRKQLAAVYVKQAGVGVAWLNEREQPEAAAGEATAGEAPGDSAPKKRMRSKP